MAFEAFILVNVTGDHTKSAYKTITRMEGIKGVFLVTGVYDLIVHVAAKDLAHLGEVILSNIRAIDGVQAAPLRTGPGVNPGGQP